MFKYTPQEENMLYRLQFGDPVSNSQIHGFNYLLI